MCNQYIDRINKRTMRDSVDHYTWSCELMSPEKSAIEFIIHYGDVKDKPVLDIGVGAGRTVTALTNTSNNYIGIDYISVMVEACKQKFSGTHFEKGDARDLSKFSNESFNLVMFSSNGLCMVDHKGRMEILKEVYRVLAPGGSFLFSSYNQDNTGYKKLFQFPIFNISINPVRLAVRSIRYARIIALSVFNRYRFKKLEFQTDEYSMVNDKCHNYATMLYYITQANQRKQLRNIGFNNEIFAFDNSGSQLEGNTFDDTIFYVTRK